MFSTALLAFFTSAAALSLLRLNPTPRQRAMIITAASLPVAQLASPLLATILALAALYLGRFEIFDRQLTDRRLRLIEYEAEPVRATLPQRPHVPEPIPFTNDMLALINAIGTSPSPIPQPVLRSGEFHVSQH